MRRGASAVTRSREMSVAFVVAVTVHVAATLGVALLGMRQAWAGSVHREPPVITLETVLIEEAPLAQVALTPPPAAAPAPQPPPPSAPEPTVAPAPPPVPPPAPVQEAPPPDEPRAVTKAEPAPAPDPALAPPAAPEVAAAPAPVPAVPEPVAPASDTPAEAVDARVGAGPAAVGESGALLGILPRYPRSARMRSEEGVVTIRVRVDVKGHASEVSVLASSGHAALDQAAEDAVRRARFAPARQGKQAVPETRDLTFQFKLTE